MSVLITKPRHFVYQIQLLEMWKVDAISGFQLISPQLQSYQICKTAVLETIKPLNMVTCEQGLLASLVKSNIAFNSDNME